MIENKSLNLSPANLSVTVLGDGGVGKTALVLRITQNEFFENIPPTIDESYYLTLDVDGTKNRILVFDTAGQEDFIAMREQYTRKADGFLLVFSLNCLESFSKIPNFISSIGYNKNNPNFCNIVLVGNKFDLSEHRKVKYDDALATAKKYRISYCETSAKTGENVTEAFSQIIRKIKENPQPNPTLNKNVAVKKKPKRKCTLL